MIRNFQKEVYMRVSQAFMAHDSQDPLWSLSGEVIDEHVCYNVVVLNKKSQDNKFYVELNK
jgi:hypothetical protein